MGDPVTTSLLLVGVAAPIREQREATKDMKRARRTQRRLQQVKEARARRAQVREAQKLRAEAQSRAVATGTERTSAISQATGSIQTQLAGNLQFIRESGQLTRQQSIFEQRAAEHQGRAALYGEVRDLAIKGATMDMGG